MYTPHDEAQIPVIVDALRTPIGKYNGTLKDIRPDDLAAHVLQALLARNPNLPPDCIEDVVLGCANQAGEDNRDVARMALLLAGYPISVGGLTVNRLCGSGLSAINQVAHAILAGEAECYIAGGVESMTRAPFVMGKPETDFPRGDLKMFDTTIGWRFTNPKLAKLHHPYAMGETAENVAETYQVSRSDQDRFALESQNKAAKAQASGRFEAEILSVAIPQRKGEPLIFSQDEHLRADTTLEKLSTLKPAFRDGGSVTAGNASGVNDGAAALLIMSLAKAKALGLTPKARILSTAVAGVDPATMGIGPVPASQKALQRAGLTIEQIDLIELNEAFASQAIACQRGLSIPDEKLNVNGGAIALGHPLGCSGARILTTLLYEMHRRPESRYGLASMCIGVGQGIATIIEKL